MTTLIVSVWNPRWDGYNQHVDVHVTPAVFTNHNIGDMIDIYKLDELNVEALYIKGRYVSGTK